jgi:FYVE zinc finger
MVYDADKDWVPFDHGNVKFEATALKAKRGESVRRKNSSNQSTESWMKKPINSDASWLPVAPPVARAPEAQSKSAALQSPAQVTRPRVLARRTSTSTTATNPVSSDSSSSSDRNSIRNRGRTADLIVSPQMDVIPDRSQRSRSTRRSQTASVPPSGTAPPPQSSSKSGRGRSSSRARTSQPSPARRRSLSQQRQPSPAPNGRGRSSSRTQTSSTTRTRSTSRARSSSRTPTVATKRRSRSNSRTSSVQPRARSSSRTRTTPHDSSTQLSASGHSHLPVRQESAGNVSQRSRSRSRGGPPPCTSRTRREMSGIRSSCASSVGPGLPPRHSPTTRPGDDHSVHTVDPNLGRDITFGNASSHPHSPTTSQGQKNKRSVLMEKLFGNTVDRNSGAAVGPNAFLDRGESIHPRILLTATVYHNTATNLWITTINTNQKGVAKNPATASKYLKAFSFASEREARESAIANAPPKMLPFTENPICFLCQGKFAVFRRAGHCRNCGVCVCNNCSTSWPSRMIPDTYNLKKESSVKICKSCDALSKSFKKALLTGNYEDAIALYGTGNINLRTPFPVSSKKDEIMYPIHCAVEGGNTNVVRWLMDDHFCPIKLIRTGSGKRAKRGMTGTDVPILTSKGRSVMTIAMSGLKIDILRYLVIERDVSVYEAKDLKSALRALEAALQALPALSQTPRDEVPMSARWDDQSFSDGENGSLSSSFDEEESAQDVSIENKSKSSKRSNTASRNGEAVSTPRTSIGSTSSVQLFLTCCILLIPRFSASFAMTTLLTAS